MIVVAVNEWKGRRGESWVRSDWFEWLIEWVSDSLWVFKIEVEWVSEHHKQKKRPQRDPVHEECFTQTLENKTKEKHSCNHDDNWQDHHPSTIQLTPIIHHSCSGHFPRIPFLFPFIMHCYSFSIFIFHFTLIGPRCCKLFHRLYNPIVHLHI